LVDVYCTGLFIARGNAAVLRMFDRALAVMGQYPGDQTAVNAVLQSLIPQGLIRVNSLDPRQYWTHGYSTRITWEPRLGERCILTPKGVKVHHANWTVGVQNKLRLLQSVKEAVAAGRHDTGDFYRKRRPSLSSRIIRRLKGG